MLFSLCLKVHCPHIHCIASQSPLQRGRTEYMPFTMPSSLLQYIHFKPGKRKEDLFLSSKFAHEGQAPHATENHWALSDISGESTQKKPHFPSLVFLSSDTTRESICLCLLLQMQLRNSFDWLSKPNGKDHTCLMPRTHRKAASFCALNHHLLNKATALHQSQRHFQLKLTWP